MSAARSAMGIWLPCIGPPVRRALRRNPSQPGNRREATPRPPRADDSMRPPFGLLFRSAARPALVALVGAALVGCAVGPNYHTPDMHPPGEFAAARGQLARTAN